VPIRIKKIEQKSRGSQRECDNFTMKVGDCNIFLAVDGSNAENSKSVEDLNGI
jgi:hypothetical protein